MNLKSRIEKLEESLVTPGESCGCPNVPKFELRERYEGKAETCENPVPDFCPQCEKPIEKQIIVVNFVSAKKPDWMTDEQYAGAYK